ncbi:MAG: hypothetical protein RIB45_09295 [Marivibrio sp.]|uniref:hypothetical protein n=1 Tax=Marivibrio sp. TaxID=2039719 RepID=UPI0032EBEDBE
MAYFDSAPSFATRGSAARSHDGDSMRAHDGDSLRAHDRDWARLDPSAALRGLLALDDPPTGLAEDALLGWLIALPGGVDPADAARELAKRPELSASGGEAARLRDLLRDVSRYPAAALSRGRRRR